MSLDDQIFSLRAALIKAKNQARDQYYTETSEEQDEGQYEYEEENKDEKKYNQQVDQQEQQNKYQAIDQSQVKKKKVAVFKEFQNDISPFKDDKQQHVSQERVQKTMRLQSQKHDNKLTRLLKLGRTTIQKNKKSDQNQEQSGKLVTQLAKKVKGQNEDNINIMKNQECSWPARYRYVVNTPKLKFSEQLKQKIKMLKAMN